LALSAAPTSFLVVVGDQTPESIPNAQGKTGRRFEVKRRAGERAQRAAAIQTEGRRDPSIPPPRRLRLVTLRTTMAAPSPSPAEAAPQLGAADADEEDEWGE